MKTPPFKLKALLDYRKFLKTQAAGRLADAARQRKRAYESVLRVNELLSEIEKELQIKTQSALKASELRMLQEGLQNRRLEVVAATKAYETALAEEERWRETILKLQKEYESVLKLQEKHIEEVRLEALRDEEVALNEFTNARFRRRVGC
jgi:flagellar export protein FliJ